MMNWNLMLLSGAFDVGQPLFYVGCFAIIGVCLALIVYLLVRKPKFATSKTESVEDLVGKSGVVTETIDGDAGTGLVEIDGEGWAARAVYTDDVYEVGTRVTVLAIEGVKIIVKTEG